MGNHITQERASSTSVAEDLKLVSYFSREYFDVNYVDGRVCHIDSPVSVVMPTRNRSPFNPSTPDGERNPLKWCLDSLTYQRGAEIADVVIVDDNSSDFTRDVVDSFSDRLNIKYLRNKRRLDYPLSVNRGLVIAETDRFMFMGDDGVCSPYYTWGGLFALNFLKEIDSVGAVNLPVYDRSTIPEKTVHSSNIRELNMQEGRFGCEENTFPEEFLSETEGTFFDPERKIFKPIMVQNVNGHLLVEREVMERLDCFPSFPTRSTAYEAEFICRLKELGLNTYLFFDPKFHYVHFKYGRTGGHQNLVGDDWREKYGYDGLNLREMLEESIRDVRDSGCSVDPRVHSYALLANYSRIFSRDSTGQKRWARRTYKDFVVSGDTVNTFFKPISSERERQIIWGLAMFHSMNGSKSYTMNEILEIIKRGTSMEFERMKNELLE